MKHHARNAISMIIEGAAIGAIVYAIIMWAIIAGAAQALSAGA